MRSGFFLLADLGDLVFGEGIGAVIPLSSDVGEDGGDLFIVEIREAGHFEAKLDAGDGDGPGDAVHEDAGEAGGRAQDPIGIDEGRSEAVLPEAGGLVAGGA